MHFKRSFLAFMRALIPACMVIDAVSAAELADAPAVHEHITSGPAVEISIGQCMDARAAQELDSIRRKADISRVAADGPPPYKIALNDTFAADSERGDIARWLGIRSRCRRQLAVSRIASSVNAVSAASLQQASALSRIFEAGVDRLIRALYYRELTYGEFAQKKYEFTREAADLGSAIDEAGHDADNARLGRTLRRLVYLKISWNSYVRHLNARPPGTVHNRRAVYT